MARCAYVRMRVCAYVIFRQMVKLHALLHLLKLEPYTE